MYYTHIARQQLTNQGAQAPQLTTGEKKMFNFTAIFSYGLKHVEVELKADSALEAFARLRDMGHNMGRIEKLKQY